MNILIPNPERADASLCIRWCVSEADRRKIANEQILSPHIVIVVTKKEKHKAYQKEDGDENIYEYSETQRYLVPLTAGAVYHIFNNPGTYKISAQIIGDENNKVEKLRKRLIGENQWVLVCSNGDFRSQWPYLTHSEIEVEVGQEFFATPPSKAEKLYIELWPPFRRSRPKDQCNWRRRRIFAYTFMLPLLLLWWTIRIGGGLLTYLFFISQGRRGLEFKAVWNEKNYQFQTIYRYTKFTRSVFWDNKHGEDRPWRALLHPWLLGILIGLSVLISKGLGWSQFLRRLTFVFLIVYSLVGLCFVVYKIWEWIEEFLRRRPTPTLEQQEQAEIQWKTEILTSLDTELEELSCSTVRVDSPPQLKTMKLKYQYIKALVCKPYAKG